MGYLIYQSVVSVIIFFLLYLSLKKSNLSSVFGLDLALVILISGVLGGRFLHIVYENLDLYIQYPLQIFKFWEGGFVFYGAVLFALISSYLFIKHKKEDFFIWADFFAPFLALSYVLGRGGCLIAGCCYGGYCDLPWAIEGRHPTQVYAMVTESLVLLFLLSEKKRDNPKGIVFLYWLIGHALGRIIMEFYRDDFRGEFIFGISLSTWISYIIILASTFFVALIFSQKKRSQSG